MTVCGAGLVSSTLLFTFCKPAVSALICSCWRAMVASCFTALAFIWAITAPCSCTVLCSFRNSLSNISVNPSRCASATKIVGLLKSTAEAPARIPTGFTEVKSNDLPVIHACCSSGRKCDSSRPTMGPYTTNGSTTELPIVVSQARSAFHRYGQRKNLRSPSFSCPLIQQISKGGEYESAS